MKVILFLSKDSFRIFRIYRNSFSTETEIYITEATILEIKIEKIVIARQIGNDTKLDLTRTMITLAIANCPRYIKIDGIFLIEHKIKIVTKYYKIFHLTKKQITLEIANCS